MKELANIKRFNVVSNQTLPTGKVNLKADYKTNNKQPYVGGTITLYANNKKNGEEHIEQILANRISLDETFDDSFDTGTPVTDTYQTLFTFTETLQKVIVDLK